MKGKKLISVFACSFLLLGGGTLLAVQSASKNATRLVRADAEPNSTYSSIYSDAFNNTQKFEGYNQVLVVYSGTAHGLTGDARTISSPEVLGMISINETPLTSLAVEAWEGQTWISIYYPSAVAAGDVMEVQTGLTIGDAIFNGFTLKLNESLKWELYVEPVNLGQLFLTGILPDSTNEAIYFYSPQTNDISSGWSNMNFVSGTIKLNESDISSGKKVQKTNTHDYYFALGQAAATDDVLTINAEFSGADEGAIYNFKVKNLQAKYDGTSWALLGYDVGDITFESVHGASSHSALYIKGEEMYEEFPQGWDPAQYLSYYPVAGEGYVKLNGTELNNVRLRKVPEIQTGYYWYLELNQNAAEGDVVEIAGQWEGCGFSFNINKFRREWNGSLWSTVHNDAGEITFTGVRYQASTAANLYLYGSDNDIPFSGSWDYPFTASDGESGVYIDDNRVSTVIKKVDIGVIIEGETIPCYWSALSGVDEGSVLEVKGNFSGTAPDGEIYSFSVPSFKRQWDGSAWDLVNVDAGDVELNGMSLDGPSSNSMVTLYATLPNDVPTSWDRAFTLESGSVKKNGTEISGVSCKKVGAQGYFFEGFSVVEDDILTFDATFVGVADDVRYHFHISEYNVQYHGENNWGLVDQNLDDITFTMALDASNATAIYFYTEQENVLAPDWAQIYPDGDNQVLFNDEDITEGLMLQKSNDHDYYIAIGKNSADGDIVTISGNWTIAVGQYSYHFAVTEFSVRFNGTRWQNLAQYKDSCKTALENYLNEEDYLAADWDTAEQIIVNGKDNIDVCTSFDDVDQMLDNFKGHLDAIPTATERMQELEEAKEAGKAEIAAYKADVEYYEEQQEERLNIVEHHQSLIDNIEDYSGIGQIQVEVAAAKEEIDALPTKADVDLQNAKDAAYAQLNAINPQDYLPEQRQQVNNIINTAEENIDAATSVEQVNSLLADALAAIAEIPTANQVNGERVKAQIAALPAVADLTLNDASDVEAARTAYNALSEGAKAYVDNLDDLVALETRLGELRTAKEQAEAFDALVDAIGEVTVADNATLTKIAAAINAYNALSEDAYSMITKEQELFAAYSTFVQLLRAAMADAAARVNEIYDAIDMRKYSAANQELLAEIKDQALAYIAEAETATSISPVEYLDAVLEWYEEAIAEVPQKKAPAKKGCGGSVVATSIVLSTLALAGLGLAISKKRKED